MAQFAGKVVAAALKKERIDLRGAMAMFNHFQASIESGPPSNISQAMLFRCSARIMPNNRPGADLIFPMIFKDDTCSRILVQVILRESEKSSYNSSKLTSYFDQMQLEKVLNPKN